MAGPYLGDIQEDATIYHKWDTNNSSGASITRAVNGTVSIYKDASTTQTTAGITDTEDFDGLTGIHHLTIDTSADVFYAVGSDYYIVLSAATIDGQTVNAVLGSFSIENRNIETLSDSAIGATTLQTDTITNAKIAADAIGASEIAANAITTSELADGTITAAKIATDAITAAKIAANAITTSELADGTITAAKIATDAITSAKIAANAITSTEIATDAIGAAALAADAVTEIADGVLIRGVSNTEGSADTTSLTGVVLAILESSVTGTTWTIRKTGGTTFVTKTVTLDATADPITGVT